MSKKKIDTDELYPDSVAKMGVAIGLGIVARSIMPDFDTVTEKFCEATDEEQEELVDIEVKKMVTIGLASYAGLQLLKQVVHRITEKKKTRKNVFK